MENYVESELKIASQRAGCFAILFGFVIFALLCMAYLISELIGW